jgi:hypothetical protein
MSAQASVQPPSENTKVIWVGKDEDNRYENVSSNNDVKNDEVIYKENDEENEENDKVNDKVNDLVNEEDEVDEVDDVDEEDDRSEDTNHLLSLHPFYLMMETFLKYNDKTIAQVMAEMSQNIKDLNDNIRSLKEMKLSQSNAQVDTNVEMQ